MTGWQPVETAPYNRAVDIWVIPPSRVPEFTLYRNRCLSIGYRIPNAVRRALGCGGWGANDKLVTGRWFYDDEGDTCIDPEDISEYAFRATHWMPLPEPPQ